MVTAPLRAPYRAKDCTIVKQDGSWEMIVFVMYGKYIVLLLAILHLLFEVSWSKTLYGRCDVILRITVLHEERF